MWAQTWPLAYLQQLDREARKVIVMNGGNHPLGSVAQLYISRKNGGRGLRSVEEEYKSTKIKAAVKLFENSYTTMSAVRKFEQKAVQTGCHLIIKDAEKYASELQLSLTLQHSNTRVTTEDHDEIGGKKFKTTLAKAQQKAYCGTLGEEKWREKLTKNRWQDLAVNSGGCFVWMNSWRSLPTHTVAAMQELYQQMLPTKLYHKRKTGKGSGTSNIICRMCGKSPENVRHVLAGCVTLAQTKYLARHNGALKILFFEMLKDLELI